MAGVQGAKAPWTFFMSGLTLRGMTMRPSRIGVVLALVAALAFGVCLGAPAVAAPVHHHGHHHGSANHGILPVTSACCAVAEQPARTSVAVAIAVLPVVWPLVADLASDGRTPSPEPPPPKTIL